MLSQPQPSTVASTRTMYEWTALVDEATGHYYYWNTITSAVVWELPTNAMGYNLYVKGEDGVPVLQCVDVQCTSSMGVSEIESGSTYEFKAGDDLPPGVSVDEHSEVIQQHNVTTTVTTVGSPTIQKCKPGTSKLSIENSNTSARTDKCRNVNSRLVLTKPISIALDKPRTTLPTSCMINYPSSGDESDSDGPEATDDVKGSEAEGEGMEFGENGLSSEVVNRSKNLDSLSGDMRSKEQRSITPNSVDAKQSVLIPPLPSVVTDIVRRKTPCQDLGKDVDESSGKHADEGKRKWDRYESVRMNEYTSISKDIGESVEIGAAGIHIGDMDLELIEGKGECKVEAEDAGKDVTEVRTIRVGEIMNENEQAKENMDTAVLSDAVRGTCAGKDISTGVGAFSSTFISTQSAVEGKEKFLYQKSAVLSDSVPESSTNVGKGLHTHVNGIDSANAVISVAGSVGENMKVGNIVDENMGGSVKGAHFNDKTSGVPTIELGKAAPDINGESNMKPMSVTESVTKFLEELDAIAAKSDTQFEIERATVNDATSLATLLTNKFSSLGYAIADPSAIPVMAVELRTRWLDWSAGEISTTYFLKKIREHAQLLQSHEDTSAPPGWRCVWNESTNSYDYENMTTGLVNDTYPGVEESDNGGEYSKPSYLTSENTYTHEHGTQIETDNDVLHPDHGSHVPLPTSPATHEHTIPPPPPPPEDTPPPPPEDVPPLPPYDSDATLLKAPTVYEFGSTSVGATANANDSDGLRMNRSHDIPSYAITAEELETNAFYESIGEKPTAPVRPKSGMGGRKTPIIGSPKKRKAKSGKVTKKKVASLFGKWAAVQEELDEKKSQPNSDEEIVSPTQWAIEQAQSAGASRNPNFVEIGSRPRKRDY
eukprot:CFRG1996T1